MNMRSYLILIFSLAFSIQSNATDTLSVSMQQADKLFLEHNFLLIANQYNIGINEALVVQARLYTNPNFTADFNVYNPNNKQAFQAGADGEKAFSLEQLLLIGGKRKTQIEIAKSNVQLARYDFEDLLRNLKFELHSSFYKAKQTEIVLRKYDAQLLLIDSIISNYEIQSQKGNIPVKEVVRLKTVYLELNNDRSALAQNLNDEMSKLRVLLGVTSFIKPVTDDHQLELLKILAPETIIDAALQNRPDLKTVQLQKSVAALNLKLQKQLVVPDITLNASYDQRGGAFNDQINSGISMPLPTWNRNQGNIKAAKLQSNSIDALRNQKEIEVKTEAQQAYDDFSRSLKEYIKAQQLYNKDFESVFNGISENFQKRNVSLIEFVDFVEAYNQSIAEIERIKTQLAIAAENINYITAKEIY